MIFAVFSRAAPTSSSTAATQIPERADQRHRHGRKELVRSAYLQNRGVARAMKVGKESIAGTMAALEAWEKRDHDGIRRREEAALNLWKDALQGLPGIHAQIIPDPTANPLDRLQIFVMPESRFKRRRPRLRAGQGFAADHRAQSRGRTRPFLPRPLQFSIPEKADIVAEQLRAY